jgi:hypothetical protein
MGHDNSNEIFTCLCTREFNSMLDLQKHIDEVIDANDFKTHGIKNASPSSSPSTSRDGGDDLPDDYKM